MKKISRSDTGVLPNRVVDGKGGLDMHETECSNCEVKVEIKFTDYLLSEPEPEVTYCPNCGKATLD